MLRGDLKAQPSAVSTPRNEATRAGSFHLLAQMPGRAVAAPPFPDGNRGGRSDMPTFFCLTASCHFQNRCVLGDLGVV